MLTVPAKYFIHAVKLLAPIAKSARVSVLQHIRMGWDTRSLTVQACNMDQDADIVVHCEADGAGTAFVHGAELYALVRALDPKGRELKIALFEGRLTISQGTSSTSLNTLAPEAADAFPAPLSGDPQGGTQIGYAAPADLCAAIVSVSPFTSSNPIKPTLSTIALHLTEGLLRVVATDGFVMGLQDVPLKGAGPDRQVCILLGKASRELVAKALTGVVGDASIAEDSTYLHINAPGASLALRKAQGSYPSYWRVVPAPERLPRAVTVDHARFTQALAFVCQKADKHTQNVQLNFAWPDLTLTLAHTGAGTASTVVGYSTPDPAEFTVAFGSNYLKAFLAATKGSRTLAYHFQDEIGTGEFTADGSGLGMILTPVRYAKVCA